MPRLARFPRPAPLANQAAPPTRTSSPAATVAALPDGADRRGRRQLVRGASIGTRAAMSTMPIARVMTASRSRPTPRERPRPAPSATAPARMTGPPMFGRATALRIGRVATRNPCTRSDQIFSKLSHTAPAPAIAPSRAADPAAREPAAKATPAAFMFWPAARRAAWTRSRRASRRCLTAVRMYSCHSKPSGFLRQANMACLP